MYRDLVDYAQKVWAVDEQAGLALAAFVLFAVIVFSVVGMHALGNAFRTIKGKLEMRAKKKLDQAVCSIIADKVVCVFNVEIHSGRMSIDEARIHYARLAQGLGIWDLYPRKLEVRPSPLDMAELKQRLLEKHRPRALAQAWVSEFEEEMATLKLA